MELTRVTFILCFHYFIFFNSMVSSRTVFEDINWEAYDHVIVVVVQHTARSSDNWFRQEDSRGINHQLQNLPHMSYYPNGVITWILKTSEFQVDSIRQVFSLPTTPLSALWNLEKVTWSTGSRNGRQSATFIFTNMFEFIIDSGPTRRSIYGDREKWGFWLNYVRSFRKVWITFDRLLVVSVFIKPRHLLVDPKWEWAALLFITLSYFTHKLPQKPTNIKICSNSLLTMSPTSSIFLPILLLQKSVNTTEIG